MVISKKQAEKAVNNGAAALTCTVEHDGWLWQAVDRYDHQRVDHYRIRSL